MNNRCYDLMDIFKNQYYVHSEFKGKNSIKNILPVMVPHLSYDDLAIKEGSMASEQWRKMIFDDLHILERQSIACDLIKYCSIDTLAMYEILKALMRFTEHASSGHTNLQKTYELS